MVDYEQCPFCERVFEVPGGTYPSGRLMGMEGKPWLEDHIRGDHHKVKLRKGSNYKWVDEAEIRRRLEPGATAKPKARKGAA